MNYYFISYCKKSKETGEYSFDYEVTHVNPLDFIFGENRLDKYKSEHTSLIFFKEISFEEYEKYHKQRQSLPLTISIPIDEKTYISETINIVKNHGTT